MTTIPKGSVVTILAPESSFQGMQGVLNEDAIDPTQEVVVEFGGECAYMFGWNYSGERLLLTFPAEQLRRDADFTLENRVNRLFGKTCWHTLYSYPELFDVLAGHDCQREGCHAKATRRILVNVWGCVCEYEACEFCAKQWHGKMVDSFPAKKKAA
jgi:hypothetical protein